MLVGGRRSCGKTTELIKLASVKRLYIVCASRERVRYIERLANEMGLSIPFPISVDELPLRSVHIKEVLVDDIEDVLSYFIRKPIKHATTSMKMKEA
ncbi:hypothetical protein ABE073_04905 [Lederbergia citrisecunda]|uniref:hypothetical protein n=1 Tax=Lederbergia citrisecunda TaxID=2833583 RepID=UPI003D295FB1